ncbi:hypothetical protein ZOSMA_46G00490 [Zostera marina]|uniref:Serinc-domain containing serine and sphingolipid biosynthesis protein n=1 Tax=Zostera marina TaxID=29655 RepID=A0A0K9P067_ZOSMR|nr:hypothetical protein ZOSMA_46G00490 [Zostera marina]
MTIVVEEGTITREDHHGELVKTPQYLCSWSTGIARYMYALIFLTTNLLAWMVRDYGRVALSKLRKNLEMQGFHSGKECLGSEDVLRISLGKIAHLGAGIFLFIQLISVISLITLLNDYFRMGNNAERCRIQVFVISITAYIVALLSIILMYIWYAPNPSCKINIFFVTMTLALIQLTTFVSTLDKFKKVKTETEEDVPYGYGFFHFVFAMGANYFAILFIGWNTHHTMEKWTIDVGWASTWVRVVNQWLSAVVYCKYILVVYCVLFLFFFKVVKF